MFAKFMKVATSDMLPGDGKLHEELRCNASLHFVAT